ncbi:MAG TPA: AGE family epimerase/isomerase, partial [Gemmatimonadaceae bacterium]|nr:AGE family epimerase/isomerase [Gemmatimonadaceae bacterium]
AEILEAQPKWGWFMVWANWLETHNAPERVKEIYALPRTLTRDAADPREWGGPPPTAHASSAEGSASSAPRPDSARLALAANVRRTLRDETLGPWYPRAVDRASGGFLSQFDFAWNATGPQDKMIVTQARHVWTTARAAQFYGGDRGPDSAYLAESAHGFRFLRDRMWDRQYGGFHWLVTRDGTPKTDAGSREIKQAYGVAFGIYALAGYYDVSHDSAALRLAQDAFRWLDAHAHDPVHRGYFNYMERDGTPLRAGWAKDPPKDQNSSIHVMEALTELYRVWPDPVVRDRLSEMLALIRDTIVVPPGTLTQFSTAEWVPVSWRDSSEAARKADRYFHDHVSFGHDIETAYLMMEASEALGFEHDTTTLRAAKRMVDHSVRYGFDDAAGGFYEAGYYFKDRPTTLAIVNDTKNWWAQAEGLNTLLIFADLYPNDPLRYGEKFRKQWAYIQANVVDHEHGGWYQGGIDKEPAQRTNLKGQIWKAAYHDGRALMNVARRLEHPSPPAGDAR